MAIVVPTSLPLIDYEDLLGDVALDDQPLDTILDATNYLYANHAPPLWAFTPINQNFAYGTTADWVWPAVPSVDALDYDIHLWAHNSSKVPTINLTLSYGSSTTGGWTAVTGWNPKAATLSGVEAWYTATASLPAGAAGTSFWKLQATPATPTTSMQIHHFQATPHRLSSISAGAKSSGFIAYNNTMLQSGSGGTIHTELFERGFANVRAVLTDREQMVFSYVDRLTAPTYTFSIASGRKEEEAPWVFKGKTSLLGQGGGPGIGARIKIQARANDAGGAANGVLVVGEVGGQRVELDCDDTDNEGYIDLQSERPVFYARCHPYDSSSTVSVRYITGRWQPGEDS